MMTTAREMVTEALAALITGDLERAHRVIARDDLVDSYYAHFFNQVVARTRQGTIDVADATACRRSRSTSSGSATTPSTWPNGSSSC